MNRSHNSKENIIAIHSQSNRDEAQPLLFEGDPAEQAFDSRALCLENLGQLCISSPIEISYLHYFVSTLKQRSPLITVSTQGKSLSKSLLADQYALDEIIKYASSGNQKIISFFDPTDSEAELYNTLQKKVPSLVTEIDFDLASELGNKNGFHEFCKKFDIPQLPGGSFSDMHTLLDFITFMLEHNKKVIVKHPLGTAGEGLAIINSNTDIAEFEQVWERWIQECGAIIAEEFSQTSSEHALHIYIDPLTGKSEVTGIYEQLVSKGENNLSHYGCKYSPEYVSEYSALLRVARNKIVPALNTVGYTGPACFDVLQNPTHFMELNTRAGANMYAHRMVEKVAASVYGIEQTKSVPFMFLAGIELDTNSFSQFFDNNENLLLPQNDGMLLFTNPSRHAFGKFDIVSMHLETLAQAEQNLFDGLVQIIGKNNAITAFSKIYQRE